MQGATRYVGKANLQNQVIAAPITVTTDGTGSAVSDLGEWRCLYLQLDVTAAAETSDDTLDVYLQTTIDGVNWIDIYHFTQVLGDGGPVRYYGKLIWDAALTEFENADTFDPGASRPVIGDRYRPRWVVVNTDAPSFTFGITANVA